MNREKQESLEYVEIKVKVPKPIVDFVEVFCDFVGDDVNEFYDSQIRDAVEGALHTLSGDRLSAELATRESTRRLTHVLL